MIRKYIKSNIINDEAIVLHTYKLGEADRIISFLTKSSGQKRAVAKGVRRISSKFGSCLEPFTVIELQLAEGNSSLGVITSANIVHALGIPIVKDYNKYSIASLMVEMIQLLTVNFSSEDYKYYELLLGALYALSKDKKDIYLILIAFFVRSMDISGWNPKFSHCVICDSSERNIHFMASAGGVLCDNCVMLGSVKYSKETFVLLENLRNGNWEQINDSNIVFKREAYILMLSYVKLYVSQNMKSLQQVTMLNI